MSEPLLRVLSIGFLTLLYLFFLRVLWITRSQLRAPKPARKAPLLTHQNNSSPRNTQPANLSLTVVDPPELQGQIYLLGESTTIGRAASAGIVLEDDFVSQFHASITLNSGTYVLEDLGSTNGTFRIDKSREPKAVTKAEKLTLGDTFRIGAITFEMTPAVVAVEDRP
ncbi:MAG: FHA domain-containing protein [Acidimicrobiales bacterium]